MHLRVSDNNCVVVMSLLDSKIVKKIVDFVHVKPRTVQEVSQYLNINWRTADRYIEKIAEETGSIETRTFREGTRGALKIVFFNNPERIASSEFQERLLEKILAGRKKEDFSPLDLYQFVDAKKRRAFLETQTAEYAKIEQDVISLFRAAKEEIIIFSGNLSWANVMQGKQRVLDVLEDVAASGVAVRVVSRVDLASLKNLSLVNDINLRLGRDAIEVRHCDQPLRCVIIDGKQARLKEIKDPLTYKSGELSEKTYVFYDILDEEWVAWLKKVFWVMFRSAIPAKKRLDTLESIEHLKKL